MSDPRAAKSCICTSVNRWYCTGSTGGSNPCKCRCHAIPAADAAAEPREPDAPPVYRQPSYIPGTLAAEPRELTDFEAGVKAGIAAAEPAAARPEPLICGICGFTDAEHREGDCPPGLPARPEPDALRLEAAWREGFGAGRDFAFNVAYNTPTHGEEARWTDSDTRAALASPVVAEPREADTATTRQGEQA
jgi:hypothetical protein